MFISLNEWLRKSGIFVFHSDFGFIQKCFREFGRRTCRSIAIYIFIHTLNDNYKNHVITALKWRQIWVRDLEVRARAHKPCMRAQKTPAGRRVITLRKKNSSCLMCIVETSDFNVRNSGPVKVCVLRENATNNSLVFFCIRQTKKVPVLFEVKRK